jgi:hypothetical protein
MDGRQLLKRYDQVMQQMQHYRARADHLEGELRVVRPRSKRRRGSSELLGRKAIIERHAASTIAVATWSRPPAISALTATPAKPRRGASELLCRIGDDRADAEYLRSQRQ